jgi:hypothetical protein
LFARAGTAVPDGHVVVNAGVSQSAGLDGDYRDMMGAQQLAALVPGMDDSMDGRMEQRDLSLDLSAGWRGWTADLRYAEKDYGFYFLTASFDDGNRARLSTWHAAVGWEHAFTDQMGVRASGIFSEEHGKVDEFDFLSPAVKGDQQLQARRWDLELDVYFDPQPNLGLTAGYRFRLADDIENRAFVPSLVDVRNQVDDVRLHDLFAEVGWSPLAPLRLTGGLRLSRLPASYGYTSEDYLNGTRREDDFPVDDRSLLTGRVAALCSLDAHQVVKLIWGNAAQDNEQIQFAEPERIKTVELNYLGTTPRWTLGASLFRSRISNIVRTIQQLDTSTGNYSAVDDNSGEWRTCGLERIAEAHPLPSLNLAFSATWQHTEDRESGVDPGYSPDLLLKFKADHRRAPITQAVYAHYVSGMDADWDFVAGPTPGVTRRIGERVDGYWKVGVNPRYEHPGSGLYAKLNAANMLDAEIRYPANQLADFTRGLIGPGPVVTARVGWKF